MKRLLLTILGITITIISSIYIISYLNLINIGYKFSEYVYFITRKIECILLIPGILILIIFNKGGKK